MDSQDVKGKQRPVILKRRVELEPLETVMLKTDQLEPRTQAVHLEPDPLAIDQSSLQPAEKTPKKRAFFCPLCSADFVMKTHVGRHIASVHVNEKPLYCSHCYRRYNNMYQVNHHIKTQHPYSFSFITRLIACDYSTVIFTKRIRGRKAHDAPC
jgi:hypothetical protein